MSENMKDLHRLNRILDEIDHFQNEEEERQARKTQRMEDKYRHLQPDYSEEDIEYF
jgi:t-SNARE complex subunit (syntaxin)